MPRTRPIREQNWAKIQIKRRRNREIQLRFYPIDKIISKFTANLRYERKRFAIIILRTLGNIRIIQGTLARMW